VAEGNRALTFDELVWLRANSPAWRLLTAQHAPLVLSFLYRVFVADKARPISATELVRGPAAREIGERLDEVRTWAASWGRGSSGSLRIEYVVVGGRHFGSNRLPGRPGWTGSSKPGRCLASELRCSGSRSC